MVEIKHSTNFKDNAKVRVLSYGKSGSGKTYFAGTMCDKGRTFVINADQGLLSIKNKDFDYEDCYSWDDFNEIYAVLTDKAKDYDNIIIDSLTEVQRQLMRSINPERGLTIDQWGILDIKMHKVIKLFNKFPCNLLFICLAMESKDEVLGSTQVMPFVKGSLSQNLPAYFDFCFYHFAKSVEDKEHNTLATKYYIMTESDERYTAKNRGGKLTRFENNHFGDIYNKIIS